MSVAKSYARALFEALSESKAAKPEELKIEEQLAAIGQAITSSKEAQFALLGPVTAAKEKVAIISGLADRLNASPLLKAFLTLLASKGRLGLLPRIREEFEAVRLASQGGIRGRVVSSEPMSAEDIQSLSRSFSKKLGKPVAFRATTDPSLLAGLRVTVNGVTYDGTLRAQLEQLRNRLFISETTH